MVVHAMWPRASRGHCVALHRVKALGSIRGHRVALYRVKSLGNVLGFLTGLTSVVFLCETGPPGSNSMSFIGRDSPCLVLPGQTEEQERILERVPRKLGQDSVIRRIIREKKKSRVVLRVLSLDD